MTLSTSVEDIRDIVDIVDVVVDIVDVDGGEFVGGSLLLLRGISSAQEPEDAYS